MDYPGTMRRALGYLVLTLAALGCSASANEGEPERLLWDEQALSAYVTEVGGRVEYSTATSYEFKVRLGNETWQRRESDEFRPSGPGCGLYDVSIDGRERLFPLRELHHAVSDLVCGPVVATGPVERVYAESLYTLCRPADEPHRSVLLLGGYSSPGVASIRLLTLAP